MILYIFLLIIIIIYIFGTEKEKFDVIYKKAFENKHCYDITNLDSSYTKLKTDFNSNDRFHKNFVKCLNKSKNDGYTGAFMNKKGECYGYYLGQNIPLPKQVDCDDDNSNIFFAII